MENARVKNLTFVNIELWTVIIFLLTQHIMFISKGCELDAIFPSPRPDLRMEVVVNGISSNLTSLDHVKTIPDNSELVVSCSSDCKYYETAHTSN